ncbi:hypothetical protein [Mycolicibacterium sp. P1-18]|uniref:hypothetical protein n=1 Tax=Mycolicibacterium sp. P1-18 TaxID=2024615 RepID=UPI0011F10696|nr:hypothetical protein [Mycolicibacterium sp. P1-18]
MDALTVLVGPSVLLDPESWSVSALFDSVAAGPEGSDAPDVPDDDADDDAAPPPDASDSAAATPWLAPSAIPTPAVTIHAPRHQRFALTDGM